MIEQKRLGRGPLAVTRLGFGAGPIGKLDSPNADDLAGSTLHEAWNAGIRYFDTAPLYGLGKSELRLGAFLRQQPRDAFVLSTKVGRLLRPEGPQDIHYDYSRGGALRSLEESLRRLALDRIDIALVHDIDVWTHGESQPTRMREALEGALPALLDLRSQGVIGAVGLGVNEWQVCRDVALACDLDCVLLAGRYTLLEQGAAAEFLPLCRERGIGVIIGGPYNSGILATGSAGGGTYNYQSPPPEIRQRVMRIEAVLGKHGVPLAAAALRYPLLDPAVSAIIPGMASPAEVGAALSHLKLPLPTTIWDDLRAEELIV